MHKKRESELALAVFSSIFARTCLPMLVRPRASLLLWTGLQIQLILGSRVIYISSGQSWSLGFLLEFTHRLVIRVNQDDFVVFVNTVLVNPVGIQYAQVPA